MDILTSGLSYSSCFSYFFKALTRDFPRRTILTSRTILRKFKLIED